MKAIISQQTFWEPITESWVRRTLIEGPSILWEKTSQYGTFAVCLKKQHDFLESEYLNKMIAP